MRVDHIGFTTPKRWGAIGCALLLIAALTLIGCAIVHPTPPGGWLLPSLAVRVVTPIL
jgi:hypothetical protein